MTKKQFIELAQIIRTANFVPTEKITFTPKSIKLLADFLSRNNPRFNRDKWIQYILEGRS